MSDQENQAGHDLIEPEIDETNWQEKVPELQKQLAEVTVKAQTNWDMLLRKEAECQNIQRRANQDIENAGKFAIERLANELLQVVDNFERALEMPLVFSEQDTSSKQCLAFVEGIKLTHKGLLDSLAKFNIVQINPLGEAFDPQFHEALSAQESNEVEPDKVLAVYAKGYLLHGRLLRPARVVVSRASTTDA